MKVVILAGGMGTRLSELTKLMPKPLVQIGKHPMLFHIMKLYAKFGFQDFVICTGYKYKNFYSFFNNNFNIKIIKNSKKYKTFKVLNLEWNITLCYTGLNTNTGGRLLKIQNFLKNEKIFFLTYGDGIGNINIQKLLSFHNKKGTVATLTAVIPPARFGAIKIKNKYVSEFKEKILDYSLWINGGFFVFNNNIFKYIKNFQSSLETDVLVNLSKKKKLTAYKHYKFWHPMDNIRDRKNLLDLWFSGKAPWK
jgi:glucose-1-phosphate cytidylyltransferase